MGERAARVGSVAGSAADAMSALAMEMPDKWSTLVFSDELVCSPVSRAESGIVFPRAISFNLSDGTVRIQNGESELGPSYACMCGNKGATKGRCVCLSGSFADALSLPPRVWPAVYEQWRRALKLFAAAHSCMGVKSQAPPPSRDGIVLKRQQSA